MYKSSSRCIKILIDRVRIDRIIVLLWHFGVKKNFGQATTYMEEKSWKTKKGFFLSSFLLNPFVIQHYLLYLMDSMRFVWNFDSWLLYFGGRGVAVVVFGAIDWLHENWVIEKVWCNFQAKMIFLIFAICIPFIQIYTNRVKFKLSVRCNIFEMH